MLKKEAIVSDNSKFKLIIACYRYLFRGAGGAD